MHRPGPLGPGGVGGDLSEMIHVDIAPHLGVLVAEVQDGAGELPVARHPVHGHPVGDRVLGVQPVGVLELDSFPLQFVGQRVGVLDGLEELGPVDEDVLGGAGELVGEEVEDKVIPLVLVGSQQDVGFLEVLVPHCGPRMFVQEGSVDDRREDSDPSSEAEGDFIPFLADNHGAVGVTETVDAGPHVVPVVRTVQVLGQSQTPPQSLLLADDSPGRQGAGRLHDGLTEEVPGERRQQVETDTAGPC